MKAHPSTTDALTAFAGAVLDAVPPECRDALFSESGDKRLMVDEGEYEASLAGWLPDSVIQAQGKVAARITDSSAPSPPDPKPDVMD